MIDWADLEKRNAPLNAFVDWERDERPGTGTLTDLTIGIKSNIAVAGLPWSAGMALHRNRVATKDAEIVARLRMSGATILGTLNMDEAALGAKTDNPWLGDTQNPHHLGYSPGGSSGGSGAAVAAGLCEAALGTDTMGSVRIPASYCGVYGLKTVADSVDRTGLELCEPSFDSIGPLARDLATLEKLWNAMHRRGLAHPYPPYRVLAGESRRPPDTGVAIIADLGGVECHPDILAAYEQAKTALGVAAEVVLPHPLSRARYAGFIKTARWLWAKFGDADPALLSDRFKRLIAYGPRRSDADWAQDQHILCETADAFRAAVDTHGAILTPTSPGTAFPHSEGAPANQADLTAPVNFADLPAITIPGGWSSGLPFGMQLIGRVAGESSLFALARHLDDKLRGYAPPSQGA